ncbi:hypothetical protein DCC77_04210 [Candidatus Uhrbacteria bacterium]|nr:MAG: hypothetical protein DCC77_04210 [Candidatus Uhrbacteria bacterium]
MRDYGRAHIGPVVNPFRIGFSRINAAMTHAIPEIIVPIGVVDVERTENTQVIFDVRKEIIIGIPRTIYPLVIFHEDFFQHRCFEFGRGIFFEP